MISRLKRSLLRVLAKSAKPRKIWVGPLRGLRFVPTPGTGLSPLYSGAEREVQTAITAHLPFGGTALDIGANWGLHTLLMARLVGPGGQVWAFEPFPPAFAELETNVRVNGLGQVRCRPEAVGSESGSLWFRPGEAATTGHLLPEGNPTEGALRVAAVRLDDYQDILGMERIDLVKIDVEGAESRVVAGADKTLARCRPTLIIELHTPEQDVAIGRYLADRGYTVRRLTPGPPVERLDAGWPTPNGMWGTVLAIPQAARP